MAPGTQRPDASQEGFRSRVLDLGKHGLFFREFPKIGVPYLGVLIIRILLFRVLYKGPLFSETPNKGFIRA